MTHPTGSLGQRVRHVLLLLALVVPLVLAGPLIAGGRAAAATSLARVQLTTLDPAIATPGSTLKTAGTVTNTSDGRLSGVEVRLRLSRTRVNSRAELAAVAEGRAPSRDGVVVASQSLPRDLAAGKQAPFTLSVDLTKVPALRDFGVYTLNVEVVASHRDGFGRVAIARTFLPWVPSHPDFKPSGFSLLWPLVGRPTRLADGTFTDDSLAVDMAPQGRLGRLVSAGARISQRMPLTWVIDPELLDAAQAMSRGYVVRDANGNRVQGAGADQAAQWLAFLRSATARGTVMTLPYADPDVVALRHRDLPADIVAASSKGSQIASSVLGRPVISDMTWPADGFADMSTLSTLRGMGVSAAVLDARAVPTQLELPYTPSGRADLRTSSGTMTALLSDPDLTAVLGQRSDPVLAGQRFLAETAMITAELPSVGTQRMLLVAPPRRWSPSQGQLDRLVDGLLGAPWIGPVPLADLRAANPPEIDRQPVRYPAAARRAELSAAYLTAIKDLHTDIATFASVLTDPDTLIPPYDAAVFRLESSWWRGRTERVDRLATERDLLDTQRAQVRVLPGNYTFGSKSGTIPLTIANGLTQDVIVDVRLEPRTPRLDIGEVAPVRVGAQRKRQVEVPANAVANGVVIVDTSLRTPNGTEYSQPVQLRIRVTQYGTVALYITLGAAGVLFLMGVIRLARRAIAHRREATD